MRQSFLWKGEVHKKKKRGNSLKLGRKRITRVQSETNKRRETDDEGGMGFAEEKGVLKGRGVEKIHWGETISLVFGKKEARVADP